MDSSRLPLRPPLHNIPLAAPRGILRQMYYCRATRVPSGVRLGAIHSLPYCHHIQQKTDGSYIHELPNGHPALSYLPNCKWCVENDIRRGPQFKETSE